MVIDMKKETLESNNSDPWTLIFYISFGLIKKSNKKRKRNNK